MRIFLSVIIPFFIFSQSGSGQVKRSMHFSSRIGMFCSQTIILDSTGLFFNESGCESRARISFGRYKLDKVNKIIFQYLPFDSINPISKIIQDERSNENDSIITITFFDRYNEPLGVNFGLRLSDTSNQVHEKWTDERGRIQINRFAFKYVSLVQLLTMYRETEAIKIGNKSMSVYFNFPEVFLMYPEMQLDKPRQLSLQLTQKGLYDIKVKKIVYKLD